MILMKYIAIKDNQKYMIVAQATVKQDGTYKKNIVSFDPTKVSSQNEENN